MYNYETIDECKKEISSKVIDLDIAYASNHSLYECFTRLVNIVMLWTMFAHIIWTWTHSGYLPALKISGICTLIYISAFVIDAWIRANYDRSYSNSKINLVRNMIDGCKEYQELLDSDNEEWCKRQALRDMAKCGNLEVSWDKDE